MQINSFQQSSSLAVANFPRNNSFVGVPAPQPLQQGQLFGWMSGLELLSSGWQQFMGFDPYAQQSAPFFSNYLEDQRPSYEQGPISATMAYPSDADVSGPPISATMAYPSDSDVSGPPISATMAYPSDSDVSRPRPIKRPIIMEHPPIKRPIADGLPFERPIIMEHPPIKRPIADGLPFERPIIMEHPPIKRPIADGLPFERPIIMEHPPIKRPISVTMAYPSDSDR